MTEAFLKYMKLIKTEFPLQNNRWGTAYLINSTLIHLFCTYWLATYYVPGIIFGTKNTAVNKTDKSSCCCGVLYSDE